MGALGYASVSTRPALTYAVGEVGQHSVNPGQCHWNAVKRIFHYLKGFFDHEIYMVLIPIHLMILQC